MIGEPEYINQMLSLAFDEIKYYETAISVGSFLADNLLEYRDFSKAKSLSFQLGLNIIFADKNTTD